jgi:hypothetical protein
MGTQFHEEIGDTLAIVNMARVAFGHAPLSELPNATMGDPAACLYYRALADCGATGVSGSNVSFSSERQAALVAEIWGQRRSGNSVTAPQGMRRVIGAFDGEKFPHYNV